MFVYLLLFPFALVCYRNIKNYKYSALLVVLSMFFLLAFRKAEGIPDLENYEMYFHWWKTVPVSEMITGTRFFIGHMTYWRLESGYVWLNWIIANLGIGFRGFLVIHAALCMIALYRFLINSALNSEIPILFLLAFEFIASYYYVLRLMLAFSILLFAFGSIKKGNNKRFILLVLTATLFHRSAIVFLILLPVLKIRLSKTIIAASYGLLFLLVPIVPLLYSRFIMPVMSKIGKNYYNIENGLQINRIIFVIGFLLIMVWLFSSNRLRSDKEFVIGYWCGLLALITESFALYVPIISRIALVLFWPFFSIALSKSMRFLKLRNNKLIIYVCMIGFLFLLYFYELKGSYIVPYRFL